MLAIAYGQSFELIGQTVWPVWKDATENKNREDCHESIKEVACFAHLINIFKWKCEHFQACLDPNLCHLLFFFLVHFQKSSEVTPLHFRRRPTEHGNCWCHIPAGAHFYGHSWHEDMEDGNKL